MPGSISLFYFLFFFICRPLAHCLPATRVVALPSRRGSTFLNFLPHKLPPPQIFSCSPKNHSCSLQAFAQLDLEPSIPPTLKTGERGKGLGKHVVRALSFCSAIASLMLFVCLLTCPIPSRIWNFQAGWQLPPTGPAMMPVACPGVESQT